MRLPLLHLGSSGLFGVLLCFEGSISLDSRLHPTHRGQGQAHHQRGRHGGSGTKGELVSADGLDSYLGHFGGVRMGRFRGRVHSGF